MLGPAKAMTIMEELLKDIIGLTSLETEAELTQWEEPLRLTGEPNGFGNAEEKTAVLR